MAEANSMVAVAQAARQLGFSASSMHIGPAEVSSGWSHSRAHIKDVQLTVSNPAALNRVLDIFQRAVRNWAGPGVDLEELETLLEVIRLNGISPGAPDRIWCMDIHSTGSTGHVGIVNLFVKRMPAATSVAWTLLDGTLEVAPTTRVITHTKENFFRSKSWSEIVTIPRAIEPLDLHALLNIFATGALLTQTGLASPAPAPAAVEEVE